MRAVRLVSREHVEAFDARGQRDQRHCGEMVGDNRSKRKWLEHAKQVSLAVLGKNRQAVECVLPEVGIKLQAPQRSSQPVAVVAMAVGGQLIAQCVDQASERPAVDSIVGGGGRLASAASGREAGDG